jgi:predicted N-acetyltransferase YhbS
LADTPIFDGPRLLRADEDSASKHLSDICFNGQDLSKPPEERDLPPAPTGDAPEAANPSRRPGAHAGETYVISADGAPVSQISIFFTPLRIYDSIVRVGSIGGVCTHPQYRGYGLASRLMQHCTERLAMGGARLMVISGGRMLYTRLGNIPMGKFAGFTLQGGQNYQPAGLVRLRPARPTDAALCSRLYQSEPVHFTRTLARFAGRFQEHEIGFHAEDWIVELDGQDAAYLLMNVPYGDAMDEPGKPVRCIFEYAGSRVALSGALAAAAGQPGIREVQAPIPWQDLDLIHLLKQFCGSPTWTALPDHTIRVINLPGLMADLRPQIHARLTAAQRRGLRFNQTGPLLANGGEDRFTIQRAKERLELDGAQLTRLMMGTSEDIQIPTASGVLAEVLAALFPLPSFFTGLDYH